MNGTEKIIWFKGIGLCNHWTIHGII